jgi:hypothetical protein
MRAFFALAVLAGLAGAQQQPAPQPKELRIVKPALRQYEDGPVLTPNQPFGPGETVFFTFQIAGFQVSPESQISLHWIVDVADAAGVKLVETAQKDVIAKLSQEDKDWMPIARHTFEIPPIILPGTYKITAKVEDRLSKRTAASETTLNVRGRKVEPSETLTARNFRFLRSEESNVALDPAVYRPGDTVWARFDIVGYKFGDRNALNVEYGIAVANADGKVLFQQPGAATEERESFYPQKYVPGVVSLTTQKNTASGEYLLVLMLRDHVANTSVEKKHPFRLE